MHHSKPPSKVRQVVGLASAVVVQEREQGLVLLGSFPHTPRSRLMQLDVAEGEHYLLAFVRAREQVSRVDRLN